ncbi:penicillin-binding protein activator [Ignisphaera sp. 4213-co]|uniref:Penicillin-binding protein activator n=1 Tax=Ignisphaera cupida TaxID=3050454 RepID=A0ABD4Z7N7_9CREN|nr:penicillin-binding protein activator [Ignisphaera sp. 4213-co]MDK6029154.1 penicillin-binding protein activator [Ignisphaera sp. 4213-co]
MKNTIAIGLIIVALVVGYGIGYASYSLMSKPGVQATPTVSSVAPSTITYTVTTYATPIATVLSGDIPIGALLPLSGALATYGAQCKEAFLLAVNDVNEWLQKLGKPWRLKPYVEDTAVDPNIALNKLMDLAARGVKVVVGPMASSEVKNIKSFADSNKILVISQSSTSMELAIPNDFIYRFVPPDKYQGIAIAHILWERGVRYVVPIWRGDTWGDGLVNYTKTEFMKLCSSVGGGNCGFDNGIRYDPKAQEFSTEVAKLNDIVTNYVNKYGKDKVGVLAISFEEVANIFTEALKYPILAEVKWEGSDGTYGTSKLVENKELADFAAKVGFWNTMAAPGQSPLKDSVRQRLIQKLGQEPIPYAYFTYDAVWAVALALDHVGKYDGEAIRNAIPLVLQMFIGASGHFQLDENGDRATTDYTIGAVVKEGDKYVWKEVGGFINGQLVIYS